MKTVLFLIWSIIPLFYICLIIAEFFNYKQIKYIKIYTSQLIFMIICGIIAYLLDTYIPFSSFLSKDVTIIARLAVYPIIVTILSFFYGGSPMIKINSKLERESYENRRDG